MTGYFQRVAHRAVQRRRSGGTTGAARTLRTATRSTDAADDGNSVGSDPSRMPQQATPQRDAPVARPAPSVTGTPAAADPRSHVASTPSSRLDATTASPSPSLASTAARATAPSGRPSNRATAGGTSEGGDAPTPSTSRRLDVAPRLLDASSDRHHSAPDQPATSTPSRFDVGLADATGPPIWPGRTMPAPPASPLGAAADAIATAVRWTSSSEDLDPFGGSDSVDRSVRPAVEPIARLDRQDTEQRWGSPVGQDVASADPNGAASPDISIGAIDVQIIPTDNPARRNTPAVSPGRSTSPLSRSLTSGLGLRQS